MDSKIQIDLELRREQAQRELSAFEQDAQARLERLQRVQSRYRENPTTFNRNALRATERGYSASLERMQNVQQKLDEISVGIDLEDAKKAGSVFGGTVRDLIGSSGKLLTDRLPSKLEVDLELRREKAQEALDALEREAKIRFSRLQIAEANAKQNPTAANADVLRVKRKEYNDSVSRVRDMRGAVDSLSIQIDNEEAKRGGRLFGIEVNKQTERFAKQFLGAYLARELGNLSVLAMTDVGGNNQPLRALQETTEGATYGFQAGAAFGPLGAAIGAVTGGMLGLVTAQLKLRKAIEREQLDRSMDNWRFNTSTGRQMQTKAFETLLEQALPQRQLRMLTGRYNELAKGEGPWSLKSLDKKIKYFEDVLGDIESDDYKRLREARERTMSELGGISGQIFEAFSRRTLTFLQAGQINDSYERQGMYAGRSGTPNVADLNRSTLEEVKTIRRVLEAMSWDADKGYNSGKAIEYIIRENQGRFGL